jgi:hypothetical protein
MCTKLWHSPAKKQHLSFGENLADSVPISQKKQHSFVPAFAS